MGIWFSSESTENILTCGSGTKRVNDECVCDAESDTEYLESLQNFLFGLFGSMARSKQECDYFGGEYKSGSSKLDSQTGLTCFQRW